MKKYLHKFDSYSDFESQYYGSGYTEPWVSAVVDEVSGDYIGFNKYHANGHSYVNLGLPSGAFWATCNLGASSPEGTGGFYALGETETKSTYSRSNYKWWDESTSAMTKYGWDDYHYYLDDEDDAVHAVMGGDWWMPSGDDVNELIQNTTSAQTVINGVTGFTFTSLVDPTKSIFFPNVGAVRDDDPFNTTSGEIWLNGFGKYSTYMSSKYFRACSDYASVLGNIMYESGRYANFPGSDGRQLRGILKLRRIE